MINGPFTSADVGQRAHRHHPAGVVADLQPLDLFDAVAERAFGLSDHLPCAAETVEVVDVKRAEETHRSVSKASDSDTPSVMHCLRFMFT